MSDAALIWGALFGVWPLADPGHSLTTWASGLDVALHLAALFALHRRWMIVLARRPKAAT